MVLLSGPVFGVEQKDSSQQPGISEEPQEEIPQSPVIGEGIRTPPDIGTAGTSTPTPPVRSESPTDEPDVLPPDSPVLPPPSDKTEAPLDENESTTISPSDTDEPLGQPDFLQK